MNNEYIDFTDAKMLRSKAELQLKEKEKKANATMVEMEVKKLLHELQVHQIELEMQNEELRQAYETAETALKKYTMLYDFAPMGYFTIDHDDRINELNFTGAEMLGDRRFSLINSNFKLYVSEKSKPAYTKFIHTVYSSGTKESCELTLGTDENPLVVIYVEGIVTGDERQCLLSAVDISAFKKKYNQ
jgi:PAS domain-containing protein